MNLEPTPPRPTSRDFVGALLLALALLIVTQIPYLAGRIRQPPGTSFSGFVDLIDDHNQYYSYVRQAADGDWLFINRLTYLPHRPALLNLEWLFVGRLMGLFDLSVPQTQLAWRSVGVVAFVGCWFALAHLCLPDRFRRNIAVLIGCTGGGFGWIFVTLGMARPLVDDITGPAVDLNAAVHPFYMLINNPHFPLPLGLFLALVACYVVAERGGGDRWYYGASVFAVLAGLMRPYDLINLWTILGLFVAVEIVVARRIEWRRAVLRSLPVLATTPLMVYFVLLFRFHPVFSHWYSQSELHPPGPVATLISYGFAGLLCLVRLAAIGRFPLRGSVDRLLLCWLVGLLILRQAYFAIPFSWQIAGDPILPAVLLGAAVLPASPGPWLGLRRATAAALIAGLVAINAIGSVFAVSYLTRRAIRSDEYRLPDGQQQAFAWLDEHARKSDVVLCAGDDARRLPTYASVRVVVGHYASAPFAAELTQATTGVLAGTVSPEETVRKLREWRVSWILRRPGLRGTGGLDVAGLPGVVREFASGGVEVLSVDLRELPEGPFSAGRGQERSADPD